MFPQLFVDLLSKYPLATDVYIRYLKDRNNFKALLALYRMQKRVTEEGMTFLMMAFREPNVRA